MGNTVMPGPIWWHLLATDVICSSRSCARHGAGTANLRAVVGGSCHYRSLECNLVGRLIEIVPADEAREMGDTVRKANTGVKKHGISQCPEQDSFL